MNSRLCGDLDKLCYHAKSIRRLNKPRICAWCGLPTYSACGRCVDKNFKSIPLHYNAKKGKGKHSVCFYQYHDDNCFGLGKNEKTQLLNGVKSDWIAPNNRDIRDNINQVKKWNWLLLYLFNFIIIVLVLWSFTTITHNSVSLTLNIVAENCAIDLLKYDINTYNTYIVVTAL